MCECTLIQSFDDFNSADNSYIAQCVFFCTKAVAATVSRSTITPHRPIVIFVMVQCYFHVNKFHNTLITTGMMCLSLRRLSPIFMPAWTIYIHKWRVNTGSVISIYKEKLKKIVLESTFIKRS